MLIVAHIICSYISSQDPCGATLLAGSIDIATSMTSTATGGEFPSIPTNGTVRFNEPHSTLVRADKTASVVDNGRLPSQR